MSNFSPKLLLPIVIIGCGLTLSLFFRQGGMNLSSSAVGPLPSITVPPTSTEPPTITIPPPTTENSASWEVGEWGSCTAGERTRTVICRNSSNDYVSESQCPTPKPIEKEVYSITGIDKFPVREASGLVVYQVNLIKPSTSDAKIVSVKATAEPKHTDAINYKHPADGSGKGVPWMTWEEQKIDPNGQRTNILSLDYAWYGIPGSSGSSPDSLPANLRSPKIIFQYPKLGYYSNRQSVYRVDVVATLSNNCTASSSFLMQVYFEDLNNKPSHSERRIDFKQKKENITHVRPFKSLLKLKTIYRACISIDDVEIIPTVTEKVGIKGQYKEAVLAEERFHSKQFREEVDWDQGGNKGLIAVMRKIFVDTKFCADGLFPDQVVEEAKITLDKSYDTISKYFSSDFIPLRDKFLLDPNFIDDGFVKSVFLTQCWREKTAKEHAGLTPNKYGGIILEHPYSGCKQDMEQPEGIVEILNKNLDYFRGYAKKSL